MRFMLCYYTYFILLFLFALAVPSSSSVGGNKNAEIEIDRLQRSTFRETENPSSDYRVSELPCIKLFEPRTIIDFMRFVLINYFVITGKRHPVNTE